jgi:ElaB/YqjD/DUF883 family membrane-anchored ribosome-binding protein
MSDENIPESESQSAEDSSWEEVGRQFQAIGESIASAWRTAWNDEQNRERMKEMEQGLHSMASQVEQVIKDTAATPEAQQLKVEAKKAAVTAQAAFEQTAQEVRPQLISALRQVNSELQKFIDRMKPS